MSRLILLAALPTLLLAGTSAGPPPAPEQPPTDLSCMLSGDLAAFLREAFEEVPVARGVSDSGLLLTVFAAASTTTWTLAVTDPSGLSCIIAAGSGFELLPMAGARPDDPAGT